MMAAFLDPSASISWLSPLQQDPHCLEYQVVAAENQQLQQPAWDSYLPMAVVMYKVPIIWPHSWKRHISHLTVHFEVLLVPSTPLFQLWILRRGRCCALYVINQNRKPSQSNFCQQVDLETSNLGELWQGCNYVNNSCHGPVADNNQVLEKIDRSSQYELNTKTKGNLAIPHQVPSLNVFFHPTGYWADGSTEINYLCIVNTNS